MTNDQAPMTNVTPFRQEIEHKTYKGRYRLWAKTDRRDSRVVIC